ncbi:hypothetical protein BJY01DRAFT_243103 [Aspergillus pseudoustus]|uniref:Uncharacterized protein n=1 Tax=Aspergillus pseudoustus TaxID=1810923 RepID=A0ABR4KUF9_9EURO
MAALQHDGVDFIPDEITETDVEAALVVSYNAASLGLVLRSTGGYDWLQLVRAPESPAHGAELAQHNEPREHWYQVQNLLESVIDDEPINHALLLGSHAKDPDLLSALKEVLLNRHDNIMPSVLDRYMSPDSGLRQGKDRLLFHRARAAATTARFGMEEITNYYWCMPKWWTR